MCDVRDDLIAHRSLPIQPLLLLQVATSVEVYTLLIRHLKDIRRELESEQEYSFYNKESDYLQALGQQAKEVEKVSLHLCSLSGTKWSGSDPRGHGPSLWRESLDGALPGSMGGGLLLELVGGDALRQSLVS